VARIAAGKADALYVKAILLALARALGLDARRAEAVLAEPLAPLDLDADSLLVRSDPRAKMQNRRKRRITNPAGPRSASGATTAQSERTRCFVRAFWAVSPAKPARISNSAVFAAAAGRHEQRRRRLEFRHPLHRVEQKQQVLRPR
jgi:hypothetical protein